MALCRHVWLWKAQPNVQGLLSHPHVLALLIPPKLLLPFYTHSADPILCLLPLYIHKNGTEQQGQFSLSLERLQLSHEGFPSPAAFSRHRTTLGTSMFSGKTFLSKLAQGNEQRICSTALLWRQRCSISFPTNILLSTVLTAPPFPALLSLSNTKISLSSHSSYQDMDSSRKKCINNS